MSWAGAQVRNGRCDRRSGSPWRPHRRPLRPSADRHHHRPRHRRPSSTPIVAPAPTPLPMPSDVNSDMSAGAARDQPRQQFPGAPRTARRPTASAARCAEIRAAAAPPKPPTRRVSEPGGRPTESRPRPARRAISSAIIARPGAALRGSARASRPASMSGFRSTKAIPPSTFRWRCSRRRSISPSSA